MVWGARGGCMVKKWKWSSLTPSEGVHNQDVLSFAFHRGTIAINRSLGAGMGFHGFIRCCVCLRFSCFRFWVVIKVHILENPGAWSVAF